MNNADLILNADDCYLDSDCPIRLILIYFLFPKYYYLISETTQLLVM